MTKQLESEELLKLCKALLLLRELRQEIANVLTAYPVLFSATRLNMSLQKIHELIGVDE